MQMTVLASGSGGNSTVFSSATTSILVDAGLSCRETLKRMRFAGEEPEKLQGIVITHEHSDHIYGLEVLARKLGIPVYVTERTYEAWGRAVRQGSRRRYPMVRSAAAAAAQAVGDIAAASGVAVFAGPGLAVEDAVAPECEAQLPLEPVSEPAGRSGRLEKLELFESGRGFWVGDIEIQAFTIPHDAADPVGFVLRCEGLKIGMCTDLGYMPNSVKDHLRGCEGLLIESNHDLEMLRLGPYPWSVKQRVMSRVGHLSNDATAEYLTAELGGSAAFVVLAHLSESNNHPAIARVTAERALGCGQPGLFQRQLHLAQQNQPLPAIRL